MAEEYCTKNCNACSHKLKTMHESLMQKQQFVERKLLQWNHLIKPIISPPAEQRLHYRRKVCLSIGYVDGWRTGMYRHEEFVPVADCPLHADIVNAACKIILAHLPLPPSIHPAYYVQADKQVILILRSVSSVSPETWISKNMLAELTALGIEGFHIHVNPSTGRRLYNKSKWYFSHGSTASRTDDGLVYSAKAFQQQIAELSAHALHSAHEFFAYKAGDTYIDLYCGIGAGLRLASGINAIGVELNGDAVECARMNAPRSTVLRGKCSERIPQLHEWIHEHKQKDNTLYIYVNPPRTGIEPEVLQWLCDEAQPRRMAYLSCSPGTLGRDLLYLAEHGYEVISVQPYDFFPQLHHVECLVLMEKSAMESL